MAWLLLLVFVSSLLRPVCDFSGGTAGVPFDGARLGACSTADGNVRFSLVHAYEPFPLPALGLCVHVCACAFVPATLFSGLRTQCACLCCDLLGDLCLIPLRVDGGGVAFHSQGCSFLEERG